MKNLRVLAIIPLLIVFLTSAQSQTYLGVKGGVVTSSFRGADKSLTQDKNKGFNGGVFFSVSTLNGLVSIQPELLYVQKGSKLTTTGGAVTNHNDLTYFEVPLLLKVNAPLGAIKPNVFAGPYAAIAFKKEYGYNKESNLLPDYTINTFDYGGIVGAGLDLNLTKVFKVTFDARYAFGFEKVKDIKTEDVKNGAFALNMGLAFKL